MRVRLTPEEIDKALIKLDNWQLDGGAIKKEWNFSDFVTAMKFLNKVAEITEKFNHHAEIFNVYNKLTLRFFTHDADGLTSLDFKVAEEIDHIAL